MEKRKLRFVWTCSNHTHHEHRHKWAAWLCGLLQQIENPKRAKQDRAIARLKRQAQTINENLEWERIEENPAWRGPN